MKIVGLNCDNFSTNLIEMFVYSVLQFLSNLHFELLSAFTHNSLPKLEKARVYFTNNSLGCYTE